MTSGHVVILLRLRYLDYRYKTRSVVTVAHWPLTSLLSPRWKHGSEPPAEGSDMAFKGGRGTLLEAFPALLLPETRFVREEAAPRHRPAAAPVSDAARPEDPEKRGVYPATAAHSSLDWSNKYLFIYLLLTSLFQSSWSCRGCSWFCEFISLWCPSFVFLTTNPIITKLWSTLHGSLSPQLFSFHVFKPCRWGVTDYTPVSPAGAAALQWLCRTL